MAEPPPVVVTLYSGPGCHLCDEARTALERLSRRRGFELREVDIHNDVAMVRRWLLEIPVIEVAGAVVTQAPVDLGAVERAVVAARAQNRGRPAP